LQVEYVCMEKEQENAYSEAIQDYRAASLARMPKSSGNSCNDLARIFPRRQISNYFVQFRKVHSMASDPLLMHLLYSSYIFVPFANLTHV